MIRLTRDQLEDCLKSDDPCNAYTGVMEGLMLKGTVMCIDDRNLLMQAINESMECIEEYYDYRLLEDMINSCGQSLEPLVDTYIYDENGNLLGKRLFNDEDDISK